MFASALEDVLHDLVQLAGFSRASREEIEERFRALRGVALLPRGKENRSAQLSDRQVALAVLGLIPEKPALAGTSSIVLSDLRPVGGIDMAPGRTRNLVDAVENLVSGEITWGRFSDLSLSLAEFATNSHGFAQLNWTATEGPKTTYYVSKLAVSLLSPGAEKTFDGELHSPASRQLVLTRRFFERLVEKVEYSRRWLKAPLGDGSEYDKEEAEKDRRRKLGVTNGSRFLNLEISTLATWPTKETVIDFHGCRVVLMPRTKDHAQSAHIDLAGNGMTLAEGGTLIRRFMSALAWCDDQFAVVGSGFSGSPVPVPVPRQGAGFATADAWAFGRNARLSMDEYRALALYREGRNAEHSSLVGYAILSYVKIVEIKHPNDVKGWLGRAFPQIRNQISRETLDNFDEARADASPETYLWSACRVAVAHASVRNPSDPDDANEIRRLYVSAEILRQLSKYLIQTEFDLSKSTLESR